MVNVLLSVTFGCGLVIAGAHVLNRRFVAPYYDVVANLVAFVSSTTASLLLGHWLPAALSACAVACWIALGRRSLLAHPDRRTGMAREAEEDRQGGRVR